MVCEKLPRGVIAQKKGKLMSENENENPLLKNWETVTCSRCGGTGHYSYCAMYGSTCFKCAGKKKVLTKRGAEALRYLREELRGMLARDVVVGMKIHVPGVPGFTKTENMILREVKADSLNGGLILNFDNFSWGMAETSKLQVIPGNETDRLAQIKQALEYQATLTKQGKPRKRG